MLHPACPVAWERVVGNVLHGHLCWQRCCWSSIRAAAHVCPAVQAPSAQLALSLPPNRLQPLHYNRQFLPLQRWRGLF